MQTIFQVRLKQLREKAGYSQYSFADKFGVAQSTVGGWEAGKREPNFDTMQRLADFFNVSVDYLLGGTAPTPRKIGRPNGNAENARDNPSKIYFPGRNYTEDRPGAFIQSMVCIQKAKRYNVQPT